MNNEQGTTIGTVGSIDGDANQYELRCGRCGTLARVAGITELLIAHTNALGRFRSPCCAGAEVTARRVEDRNDSLFVGAFMVDSGIDTIFPFGFVVAPTADERTGGLHFECALDIRHSVIERLRKGDVPGGPLTVPSANPRSIIKHLREVGLLPERPSA
jgi:hypothetical protein